MTTKSLLADELEIFRSSDIFDDGLDGSRPDHKIQSSLFPTDGAN
jgi:hypothetical protein